MSPDTDLQARLAVRGMPGSGTPAELLDDAGIDADSIVRFARDRVFHRVGVG